MTKQLIVLDMPLEPGLQVSHPERLALRFSGQEQLAHIWTFAYKRRFKQGRSIGVDYDTLLPQRLNVIRDLATLFSKRMTDVGHTAATGHNTFRSMRSFMDWADTSGDGSSVWCDRQATEATLLGYFGHLRATVAAGAVSSNTAAGLQQELIRFARDFYDDDICKGFRPLKQDRSTNPTKPPNETELSTFYHWITQIFQRASEAILEHKAFPIGLNSPNGEVIWLLPNGKGPKSFNEDAGGAAWDAATGTIRTIEQVTAIYEGRNKRPRNVAMKAVKQAHRILEEANSNPFHGERLSLASYGCLAFGALFSLETGANQAVLAELDYSDDVLQLVRSSKVTHTKFKALKLRAGAKEVTLNISAGFIPRFVKYLELREKLLRGEQLDKLLICLGENNRAIPFPKTWLSNMLHRRLGRLGVNVPTLGGRKLRAAKHDHHVRKDGPDVAAVLMNHSLATTLRSYSNGSEDLHAKEMGSFLGAVAQAVVERAVVPIGAVENGVGRCSQPNAPNGLISDPPVPPTCRSTEGCLFCDKFRVHADERDIRKLLSCRYCLALVAESVSPSGPDAVIADRLIARINGLLEEIGRRGEAVLIRQLEHEVTVEEKLDPFWTAKLEQLALLGIL